MVQTMPFLQAVGQLDLPDLKRNLFSSDDWGRVILKLII